jgi:hypothetical protein
MEDSTLEIVVYLIVGSVIGFAICFSALKQSYLSKYKKSVDELKIKYADDVSQSILISKRLLEAEEQNEILANVITNRNSTIEALAQEGREIAERFARLETDLTISQAALKEKEEELINSQARLRMNRSDLEYTATLEAHLEALKYDYELKLTHQETKIQNLQHRLDDVERAKRLLIEELNVPRLSARPEGAARLNAQPTEIQEFQIMVHDLIEANTDVDAEAGTKAQIEEALAEARAAHQNALQEKNVEIAQLLEYLSRVEHLSAIAAKRDAKLRELESQLSELQASHQILASEKATQESELAEWIERSEEIKEISAQLAKDFETQLQTLAETYQTELGAKDAQIAELLERVSFVGTLRKQYAESETELQELEEKFQTVVKNKNQELHFLQERFNNLEKLHATAIEDLKTEQDAKLAEKDFVIYELQTQSPEFKESHSLAESHQGNPISTAAYQPLLNARDEEIADLLERIEALETLFVAHSEATDLKLKEKEEEILKSREDAEALEVFVAAHSQEIDARLKEKEAEIYELQECIAELESGTFISQELKKMEAEYQAALQTKNSEIVRLQMRINQLEPFSALVAQRDARIRELDSRYQTAIGAKDAEIAHLQNRLKELKSTVKMAY